MVEIKVLKVLYLLLAAGVLNLGRLTVLQFVTCQAAARPSSASALINSGFRIQDGNILHHNSVFCTFSVLKY